MLADWLKRRHLNRQGAAFWRLLKTGHAASALELYEAELAPHKELLSLALRAAFHLQRWLALRREEDAEALLLLATGAPPGSGVAAACQTLQRLRRQSDLARALATRGAEPLPPPVPADGDKTAAALEAVAAAAAEAVSLARAGGDGAARREVARRLLPLPPSGTLDGVAAAERARAHLTLWAASVLGSYEVAAGDPSLFEHFDPGERAGLREAVVYGRARELLRAGQAAEAARVFRACGPLTSAEKERELMLVVGLDALRADAAGAAADWFARLLALQPDAPRPWRERATLALGLALLADGKYSAAREALAGLDAQPPGDRSDDSRDDVRAQADLLSALSLLVAARHWETPRAADDPEAGEHDREVRVQNAAIWRVLRAQLDPIVERLARGAPEAARPGHLLRGLVAYVDRNDTLVPQQLAQFAAAVEAAGGDAARMHLNNIEGALAARAQATEEAVRLVRRKDYRRLRELKETVLESLGDAIPSPVRAAVYLTLGQDGTGYDPLPDLQRLPRGGDDALIGRAIAQAQVARTLDQLGEECRRLDSSRALPPLAPLSEFDDGVARRAALAAVAVQLRRGNVAGARENMPAESHEQDRESHLYARLYLAWLEGDVATCRELHDDGGASHPLVSRHPNFAAVLAAWSVIHALEANRANEAWRQLAELGGDATTPRTATLLTSLVVWLVERRRPEPARALLQCIRLELFPDPANAPKELEHLQWVSLALSAAVAAQAGQYSACAETVQQLLTLRVPRRTVFGPEGATRRVLDWLRLFQLEAELGLTAATEADLDARWRSAQRALAAQLQAAERDSAARPYLFLIGGLVAHLSPDAVADEETIDRLRQAQQALDLGARAGFIEAVIGQLSWRKRVLEEFWQSLRAGDFKRARAIYLEELLPAFSERVPHDLQLGMLMATWGAGDASPADLLHRLGVLEQEAPELSRELFADLRGHIRDGERVLRLVEHLRHQQLDEATALIEQTQWFDYQPGMMPVPVAVTLLYSYYKTKRGEDAALMGYQISRASNLAPWVQDYGSLILGYVLFDSERFARVEAGPGEPPAAGEDLYAAEVFAQATHAVILGHDLERYEAAAHFNKGLQLLKAEQREKAFNEFALALERHDGGRGADLAPLFIHFALQSLENRDGSRARASFRLLSQSLEESAGNPQAALYKLLADMGAALCNALMTGGGEEVAGGEGFLRLLEPLADLSRPPAAGERQALRLRVLELNLHLMAICQELRKESARGRASERQRAALYKFLGKEIESVERLRGEDTPHHPALLAVKGARELLRKGGGNAPLPKEAVEWLEGATRLGASAPKLVKLLDEQQRLLKDSRKATTAALDLFDVYLANGSIPHEVRNGLARRDDLAELYRLNRSYTPRDIIADDTLSGVHALKQRVEHLLKYVEGQGGDDLQMKGFRKEIEGLAQSVADAERQVLSVEQKVMAYVADKLRAQSL